jgi:hypothetical protein
LLSLFLTAVRVVTEREELKIDHRSRHFSFPGNAHLHLKDISTLRQYAKKDYKTQSPP